MLRKERRKLASVTVLVIAPHPDDESIGCGGSICLHADRGDRTVAVFLTSGELGSKDMPREEAWRMREAEAGKAAKVLGLAETIFLRQPDWVLGDHTDRTAQMLAPILEREKPELLYCPHPKEWHPDHQAASLILRIALGLTPTTPAVIRGYEVWTPLSVHDDVEDITAVMKRKLSAIRAHRSQVQQFAYPDAVTGLNRFRGIMTQKGRYAEVFQLLDPKPGK